MRPSHQIALYVALAAYVIAAPSHAENDPATEVKLLYLDGKWREGDTLLEKAPPEVQNDVALRLQLGDTAMKFAHTMEGDSRRHALDAARSQYGAVVDLKPAEAKAATGVLTASKELCDLDVEQKLVDEAKAVAKTAIAAAEKAQTGGIASPDFKVMLGRMYAFRASFYKTMKDVDALVADTTKAATLLAEGSAGSDQANKMLSEASAVRLRCANLIHEQIPVETEKRDDEALTHALDLATKACNLPSAAEPDFTAHLNALRLAHVWGMKPPAKPYMTPLVPALPNLKVEIPKAAGWTKAKVADDWELGLERDLGDTNNFGKVQISLTRHAPNPPTLGKPWNEIEAVAQRRFEADIEDYEPGVAKVAPVLLTGRNVEIWHFELAGTLKGGTRTRRSADWIGFIDKKREKTLHLRIYDWRRVPDLTEPDIVAFVASVIGEGVWPPGAAPATNPGPEPKKPPTKKK